MIDRARMQGAALAIGLLWVCAHEAGAQNLDSIELEPMHEGPIVLGDVDEVDVAIFVRKQEDDAQRPLRLAVNVGRFLPIERVKEGEYRARLVLPKTRHPQVAFVAAWRETGPEAAVVFRRIPLHGRTSVPVRAVRGAKVSVLVGETVFGEVVADRLGRARVPIIVPPGLETVVARALVNGEEQQASVLTRVPPHNHLTLAVTPYLIPADGRSSATVHAFYDVDSPPPIEQFRVTATGGVIEPLGQEGQHHRFRYTPARDLEAKEIALSARVVDDRASRASATLLLGAPRPEEIHVDARGLGLVAGRDETVAIRILVCDRLGLGVSVDSLTATVSNARLVDLSGGERGEYLAIVAPPSAYPPGGTAKLRVSTGKTSPALEVSEEIPVAPEPWPARAHITTDPKEPLADPATPFQVLVQVFDAKGDVFDADDLQISSMSARVGPLERVDVGSFRATAIVLPEAGRGKVDLHLSDSRGRFALVHEAKLRPPTKVFSIAPHIGLTHGAGNAAIFGLEFGVRPQMLDRRLRAFGSGSYRRISTVAHLDAAVGGPLSIRARLETLPMSVGAALDLARIDPVTLYGGAALVLSPYRHSIAVVGAPTGRDSGLGVGGRLHLGIDVSGPFAELEAGHTSYGSSGFESPTLEVGFAVGYRWEAL